MTPYCELGKEELLELKKELTQKYEDAKGKGLKLDMSRGKPSTDQLDMTMPETTDVWKEFTVPESFSERCWVWIRSM